jgi:hypothetical protein
MNIGEMIRTIKKLTKTMKVYLVLKYFGKSKFAVEIKSKKLLSKEKTNCR